MPNPQAGTILGAYRVEGTIGAGSMGEVFRGVDTGLNRRVAIKILSEKHRDSNELRARFVREGRAVAAISHPNVVQVFATGSFDERPYIAMELLDGTDLGSTVEKTGPLDSLSAAHVALDATQGLAAASKAGLIHRDVKPSNLVRLSNGEVKVTDFGLAKPMDPGSEPALTAMGVVVGTPDYIAPEQARGEPIDERVDIYALGGTLYFLLTGIPPFRTGKPAEDKYLKVVARHLRNPAPDAATTNPRVDRELADLTRAMMAKKPAERPTYDELVNRLSNIIARLDPSAVPMVISSRGSRPNAIGPSGPLGPSAEISVPDHSATVSDGGIDEMLPKRAFPIWLVVLTLLSLATFAAGLVVYLRKPAAASTPTTTGSGSAGSATASGSGSAKPATKPVDTKVPDGMILVKKHDGTPWFYVDAQSVTNAGYRQLFAKHDPDAKATDPVENVSYTEARSYAATAGRRLLTSEEWDAAAVTPGFVVEKDILEWVDSPDEKTKIARQHGKTEKMTDQPQKNVTFRTAKSL